MKGTRPASNRHRFSIVGFEKYVIARGDVFESAERIHSALFGLGDERALGHFCVLGIR